MSYTKKAERYDAMYHLREPVKTLAEKSWVSSLTATHEKRTRMLMGEQIAAEVTELGELWERAIRLSVKISRDMTIEIDKELLRVTESICADVVEDA